MLLSYGTKWAPGTVQADCSVLYSSVQDIATRVTPNHADTTAGRPTSGSGFRWDHRNNLLPCMLYRTLHCCTPFLLSSKPSGRADATAADSNDVVHKHVGTTTSLQTRLESLGTQSLADVRLRQVSGTSAKHLILTQQTVMHNKISSF
jgi:hypothetical protein